MPDYIFKETKFDVPTPCYFCTKFIYGTCQKLNLGHGFSVSLHNHCAKSVKKQIDDGFVFVRKIPVVVRAKKMDKDFEVETLEGKISGKAGDYLMIGVEGERYPCKEQIFEKTYEVLG